MMRPTMDKDMGDTPAAGPRAKHCSQQHYGGYGGNGNGDIQEWHLSNERDKDDAINQVTAIQKDLKKKVKRL